MFVIDESAFCVKGVGDLEVTSQKKNVLRQSAEL